MLAFKEWTDARGTKVLLVQDAAVERAEVTAHVAYGSFDEPRAYDGLAHLREHLVGYAASPESEAVIPWVRRQHLGDYWFKTRDTDTVYFAAVEAGRSRELLQRLDAALKPRAYPVVTVRQQIQELEREWREFQGQDSQILEKIEGLAVDRDHPAARFRSGSESSLPLASAEAIAHQAERMSAVQHKPCALSWVFVSPFPLREMQRILESAWHVREAPPGQGVRCGGDRRRAQDPRPLWRPEFSGAIAAVEGFEHAQELWLVWATPELRSRDVGEFWVSQMEGAHPGSLRQLLRARGWIKDLSVNFASRYFEAADRWWLRLHLTDAGRSQMSSMRQAIESWWQQWGLKAGEAAIRYEGLAAESRRWAPVASRAQWGFQMATALSSCSGRALFQDCASHASRFANERTLPRLRWTDMTAWTVPGDRSQRLAWLDRWRQRVPQPSVWPDLPQLPPIERSASDAAPAPFVFDGWGRLPPGHIVAEWRRLNWPVCEHPGNPKEPFIATMRAQVDLSALDEADRVRALIALERGRSRDGVLGPSHYGFGQTKEWHLRGTVVELSLRGRRDWQVRAMHAWLRVLGDFDAREDQEAALEVLRRLANEEVRDPSFENLVGRMMRDAGRTPSQLSAWLSEFGRSNASVDKTSPAARRRHLPIRLWLADGAFKGQRTDDCQTPLPAVEGEAWRELGPVMQEVALPPNAQASALLLRCEPWEARRFWASRHWRSSLRLQLRTLAREQGLGIPFISVPAFAVPGGGCWGVFAEAAPDAGSGLAESLRSLIARRTALIGQKEAPSRPGWHLPEPECDVEGWQQVWSTGWPEALADCPFGARAAEARTHASGAMEAWLQREWADTQAWRVYLGTPSLKINE
ncbi:insulinase family protein [Pelomonas sp. BJYL3]|uniref:insulinase family protein n=1 Tax=Pelomonas sp. BJYL3 TaxID=2976697 RepID=UPI0022B492FD|nr:insulinase family protein [Pelomonas sp. BJYL3]